MLQYQTSIILALSVVVSALGLLAFWGETPQEDAGSGVPTALDAKVDDLSSITIERREDRVELVKGDDGWMITAPVQDRANAFMVDRILQAITGARTGALLENVAPEALGLEPKPVASVELVGSKGTTSFEVGDRAPVGWHDYLRDQEGSIFAVRGSLSSELGRKPDDYRHPGLIEFDLEKVTEVRLKSGPGTLDVRRQPAGRWALAGFGAADPGGIEDLLVALSNMRFTSFYHAPLPSIDEPEFEIEIVQEEDVLRLVFGEVTAVGRLALDVEGRPGFVDAAASVFLTQGPTDLGVSRVLDERPDEVTSVTIGHADSTATYENGDGGWSGPGETSPAVDIEACLDALSATAVVYRLNPPSLSDSVLSNVVVRGDDFERRYDFYPVDETFVAVLDTQVGGPLRVSRVDYAALGSACGLVAP